MKIELFYAPTACPLVPYLLLKEAGADFETRVLNLRAGEQRAPDYLSLTPKQKVPLLLVDGAALTENLAIQTWIARSFLGAGLLPADTWGECQALSILSWCASGFHPVLSRINSPAKYCGTDCDPATVTEIAKRQLMQQFRIAEEMLSGRQYFFDSFSVADAYVFWCTRRAGQLGVDLSAYRACHSHFNRVADRESAKATLKFEAEVLTAQSG